MNNSYNGRRSDGGMYGDSGMYGGGGGSSGRTGGNSHYLEDENEELTTTLRSKVQTLKSMTIDIGREVRDQNNMISSMDDDMVKSGNLLERTMRRVGGISRAMHNYHTPLLFAFVFFVFLLLWVVLKFR